MSLRKFTDRNGSRVDGSVRWTSTNGRSTARSASRSVHDRGIKVALVQAVDERALVVRLEEHDLEPEIERLAADVCVDLVHSLAPIELGLARAEQIQVRALEDEDPGHPPAVIAVVPARTAAATSRTSGSGTSASIA